MKKFLFSAAMLLVGVTFADAQLKLQPNNVDEILKAMTLEEKATLVVARRNLTMAGFLA